MCGIGSKSCFTIFSTVNSVSFAPHEYGLMLACGSSDGSISVITCTGKSCLLIYAYRAA